MSGGWPVLWLSTYAVQLTVLIGDDDQLVAWPVLWLSTNAVQLTIPIGDDGQLMSGASGGPPVLVQMQYSRPSLQATTAS